MATRTDAQWSERLANIMPDNFMDNISGQFLINNGILNTMMNRIGMTLIHNVDKINNPFGDFTKTIVDYGDTIQEYKVKVIDGKKFTADEFGDDSSTYEPNPFAVEKNKPIAQYSQLNDKVKYRQTIFDNQLKLAFTSEQKFGDFVAGMYGAVQESDNLDKFIKWKKFMSNEDIYGTTDTITATDNTEYFAKMIRKMKDTITKFRFPSKNYNKAGDMVASSDVSIIMKAEDKNKIDMDILAGVYNMNMMELPAKIRLVDDFATVSVTEGETTTDKEVACIIVDDRFFSYFPRTPMAGAVYNPEDLYTNMFLNVQGTYTAALFRNAEIVYKGAIGS
jgi:hypothetical protein